MGVHKLTAGDGYTYLTRQVAAHDATDRGHQGLADYYAEKGESPGRWFGTGLGALDVELGSEVTEAELIEHAREKLAHFKAPKRVVFVDGLPRNASGKILKRELRDRFAQS